MVGPGILLASGFVTEFSLQGMIIFTIGQDVHADCFVVSRGQLVQRSYLCPATRGPELGRHTQGSPRRLRTADQGELHRRSIFRSPTAANNTGADPRCRKQEGQHNSHLHPVVQSQKRWQHGCGPSRLQGPEEGKATNRCYQTNEYRTDLLVDRSRRYTSSNVKTLSSTA